MSVNPSYALQPFTFLLTTVPTADEVLTALRDGPLSHLRVAAAGVWVPTPDRAWVMEAQQGIPPDLATRYETLPLDAPSLPLLSMITAGLWWTGPADTVAAELFAGLDEEQLREHFARVRAQYMTFVPMQAAGRVDGYVGFSHANPGDAETHGVLMEMLSNLLGLWVSNPRNGIRVPGVARSSSHKSLAFTVRQQDILEMVSRGISTPKIAEELGVSTSSVKADLQVVMRTLRVRTREAASRKAQQLGLLDPWRRAPTGTHPPVRPPRPISSRVGGRAGDAT